MTIEKDIVLLLCRYPMSNAARARTAALLERQPDWDSVFQLAERWEVEPVVFSNLRLFGDGLVPSEVRSEVENAERVARTNAVAGTLRSAGLCKALTSAGIPVILLKGPALGFAAYDDFSLRTFADVDLLVRREDVSKAAQLLLSLGYQRDFDPMDERELVYNHHALEFSRSGQKVEIHWTLLERHLQLDIDLGEVWAGARTVSLADNPVKVMAPHHLFLFACAHGAKHEWERVRWVCDVAQLAERLTEEDVKSVEVLSNKLNARRLVLLGLILARDLLGANVSNFHHETLGDERALASLIGTVRQRTELFEPGDASPRSETFDPRLRALLFWVRSRERTSDKVACLGILFFSPAEGDGRFQSVRWVTRPFRLVARALRYATRR